jgi:signal transduction histidine kinase
VSGRIAAEGRPRIVNGLSVGDLAGVQGMPAAEIVSRVRSVMGVPLEVAGKVIGVVTVASARPRVFTDEDLELLAPVAARAAPAVERARLVETTRAAQERLSALSRRVLVAQEEERRRLAVELHDDLGQVLTAVKINLQSLQRLSSAGAAPPHLVDAIASVDQAMQRVRNLALDLRPSVLDDLGLAAALRWYVDRFARRGPLKVHVSIDPAVSGLEPALETACFRLAQEALTNVVRHARAQHVWFDLHLLGHGLELTVRDDGAGFDVAAARSRAIRGGSMGLLGMEERVSLTEGELEIVSAPGQGTMVRARFAATAEEARA